MKKGITTSTKPLAQIAKEKSIYIGTAINSGHLEKDMDYALLAAREFNLVTAEYEMKQRTLNPEKDKYNFELADKIISFAEKNNMAVRGHTLVWSKSMPAWMKEISDKKEFYKYFERYITDVVGKYKGKIPIWDVVNEPLTSKGGFENNLYTQLIGKDYIELALKLVRQLDPVAKVFINEWGADDINPKSDALYNIAKDLLNKDIPLDGIGFQMHMSIGKCEWMQTVPDFDSVYNNLKRFSDLGLEIHITEMDVLTETIDGTSEEKLQKQANTYQEILKTALKVPNFKCFTVWGVNDKYSWLGQYSKENDSPVLFDKENIPKPAYFAIQKVLDNNKNS